MRPVTMRPVNLPDPALVVLVGPSGSGKSTWAADRYAPGEIVSSDALRAVVGTGEHDLDASRAAFEVLDAVVAARTARRLTCVVDTLGLDPVRRRHYLDIARAAGLPAIAVLFDTPAAECRRRNASRDVPVPAAVLDQQLRAARRVGPTLPEEGWDLVLTEASAGSPTAAHLTASSSPAPSDPSPADPSPLNPSPPDSSPAISSPPDSSPADPSPAISSPPDSSPADSSPADSSPADSSLPVEFILQISRFPWGDDPLGWLTAVAAAAVDAGFAGVSLMDHLIQIPQVGRAWEPLADPWAVLAVLGTRFDRLRVGTLVSPVTFHRPGVLAKTVATVDALTGGGRVFCGLGAGWWDREHTGFGLPFPPPARRLDLLEETIETLRALWAPGTKEYVGQRISLPETTCYPRPTTPLPIIVGGSGPRTLRLAARLADGCNVRTAELARALPVLHAELDRIGRSREELSVSVLDVPIVGADRSEVAALVERLRGRTAAATFAARHHAGTVDQQIDRYRNLASAGVRTVFLALPDLAGPDQVLRCAPIVDAVAAPGRDDRAL